MFIQSQDKDVIFTLADKGLLKGTVYTEDIYINKTFYGTNIFGKNLFKKHLLGTYEEDEAEQIVGEVYKLLKARCKFYAMPEAAMDLEELGVEL